MSDSLETNEAPLETTENQVEQQVEATVETPEVEVATVVEEASIKKEFVPIVETAHDDFDWTVDKRNVVHYTKDEHQKYDEEYSNSLRLIQDHDIVEGIVVAVTNNDVVLNIGFKSDGLVPISEFRDVEDLAIGNVYDVYVVNKEDKGGHLILSRKDAKLIKAWEQIKDAFANGTILTGKVISKTKGGLIANVLGLETFLPGSQIDVKPITDYDMYVGVTLELKIVKLNEAIKNAVVSHKALIESDIESQRDEIISKLEKGQVLEGVIKNITDFGAFIDLGGVDGLLYITDISWGRISHPKDVLEVNQKLNVVVLEFDDNKKRISLGLKQLTPHPWDNLDKDLEIGSKITGKVVNVEDYGAFLELSPGIEGLIHVSEISWSSAPSNSREFFKLGDMHEAVIMTLDREERKMSLSVKRMQEDPWLRIAEKFPAGSRHKGIVKNLTIYGVFVELEGGIGGMVHISDLSWTKRYAHPSEFTKVGAELELVVLESDNDSRKLSLGHKQIEEDPWDSFENVFPINSVHEATVMEVLEMGCVVQLPYGLEAFCPKKQSAKEQGGFLAENEKAPFRIIEFSRNEKKIVVSHSRIWEEVQREKEDVVKKEKKVEYEQTRSAVKNIQKSQERSTLGDLSALSDLKEKMDNENLAAYQANTDAKEEAKKAKATLDAATDETPTTLFEEKKEVENPVVETPKEEATVAVEEAPKEETHTTEEKVEEITPAVEAPKEETTTIVEETPVAEEKAEEVIPVVETPTTETARTTGTSVLELEGVGPAMEKKFNSAGISTIEQLLEAGATKKGREEVAEKSGIDESRILRFVNMADLSRVQSVDGDFAELLEAAGVDSIKELRHRVAEHLLEKMLETNNGERKISKKEPTLEQVTAWIEEAKTLEPKVTH